MIRSSDRVSEIKPYYFATKLKAIAALNASGADIINLGIGSPDLPPPALALETLTDSLKVNAAHQYQSYYGLPALRQSIIDFYERYLDTHVNGIDHVLPLIGSKEGIMHISMAYLNPGDQVLVPNPGYPSYASCTQLAGGEPVYYNLTADNGWSPDIEALRSLDLTRVKLMWINSPHMPTGAVIPQETLEALVAFAHEHSILLCHDNPYAFILNEEPTSLLSIPQAESCVVELLSMSKAFNMSGWRVGAVIGTPRLLDPIIRFKSNMDSGMFKPVQLAAAAALRSDQSWFDSLNATYRKRKQIAYNILDSINCKYTTDQSGMFVWAKHDTLSGREVSDKVLDESRVFITPGFIFGDQGSDYVRVSLCSPIDRLEAAHQRIITSNTKRV